jgi:hypothetical protein
MRPPTVNRSPASPNTAALMNPGAASADEESTLMWESSPSRCRPRSRRSVPASIHDVRPDVRIVLRLFDPDFAVRVQRGFGIRFTRSVSQLAAPAFAAAAMGSEVIASVPIGDRRIVLFARLPVPKGSDLEGLRLSDIDHSGELRVLAIADPEGDVARWSPDPASEIIDAGEDLIVAATRAGLASVLKVARVP